MRTDLKASDSITWLACSPMKLLTKILRLTAEYASAKEYISQQLLTERTVAKNSSVACTNPKIYQYEEEDI